MRYRHLLFRANSLGLQYVLLAATAAALLLALFFRLYFIGLYDVELGGIEQYPVALIHQRLNGVPIYTDPEVIPYRISQLTPLYYECCAAAGRLIGTDPGAPQQTYILSRVLSLFFNVLSLLVFWRLLRRLWQVPSGICFVLSTCLFLLLTEHYYSRSDSLYLLFHLCALDCFFQIHNQHLPRWRNLALLAFWVVLAFYSKQAAALLAAYLAICWLWGRQYTALFRWTILGLLCFAGVFLVLIGTEVEAFYKNSVLGLRTGFDLSFYRYFYTYRGYLPLYGWFLWAFYMGIRYWRSADRDAVLLAIGIPLATLFALLTGAKNGATYNHWTELWVFVLLLTGKYGAELYPHGQIEKSRNWVNYGLVFLLLSTFALKNYQLYASVFVKHIRQDTPQRYVEQEQLANYLRKELQLQPDEYVYTTFREYLDLFLIHNTVFIHKDMVEYMYFAKTYDYAAVPAQMRSGNIKYLVTCSNAPSQYPLDDVFIQKNDWEKIATIAEVYHIYRYQSRNFTQ